MKNNLLGYNGKIANINLTTQTYSVKDLDVEIAKDYLGGSGLSARITYDLLSENDYKTLKENPFSEINPLIFATGPVTGTIRPSSGRYSVTGISPLTGIWGEGTSGGFFCVSLRNSGYDALVIVGKARKPTFLYINNGVIEFRGAEKIWGKDTYKTQTLIKKELNNEKIRVATIGIAGENLVKYAGIINDEGRAVGRCGLGALMGSKNLKALAIHGTKSVPIANPYIGKELIKQAEEAVRGDLLKSTTPFLFTLYGTNCYLDIGLVLGDTPGYYFTESEFPAEKLTGKTLKEKYPVFDYGCAGCTIRCGKRTVIEDNGKEIEVDGPEYESVAAFGPLCGIFESKEVIFAHHKCNIYGMDTISTGVCIAFLIYLIENNIGVDNIKKHLNGIPISDIRWGNSKLLLELIDKIATRVNIGKILAEGTKTMAKIFDIDPGLAAHVKGLEIPMHDPRAFAGQALSYITCNVGANHEKCDWFNTEMTTVAYPNLRIKTGASRYSIKGREKGVINLQNIRAIDDSAVNCNFANPEFVHFIGHINASTGFNYDQKSLLKVGERINTLKRLINCNLGITRKDDKLPNHLMQILSSGKTMGIKIDLEDNLKTYYKLNDWDWETGRPTNEKLKELGIRPI